jgi:hypothetical protein
MTYYYYRYGIQIIILLWQADIIDGLTGLLLMKNFIAQYGAIVVGEYAATSNLSPSIVFAPVRGLKIGYQYVQCAPGRMEKIARIATESTKTYLLHLHIAYMVYWPVIWERQLEQAC